VHLQVIQLIGYAKRSFLINRPSQCVLRIIALPAEHDAALQTKKNAGAFWCIAAPGTSKSQLPITLVTIH
jgi:hypothetical protein